MHRRSVPLGSDVDEVSARKVVPLHRLVGGGPPGDDRALGDALVAGHPGAAEAFYDRYAGHVSRVLVRVMGVDAELRDLLHEVFVRALAQATRLDDPSRLKAWVTSIAVFTARGCIRRRRRSSWLGLASAERTGDPDAGR